MDGTMYRRNWPSLAIGRFGQRGGTPIRVVCGVPKFHTWPRVAQYSGGMRERSLGGLV